MCCKKNCTVLNFCCGCHLRTGCLVFGCLQLIWSLFWGIFGILDKSPHPWEVLIVIPIIHCIFTLIIGLMMIIGTYEKNIKVLWTTFYTEIIWALFCFISPFIWPVSLPLLGSVFIFGSLSMVNFFLSASFLIFLRSFILEIKEEGEKEAEKQNAVANTDVDYYEKYPLDYADRPLSLGSYINEKIVSFPETFIQERSFHNDLSLYEQIKLEKVARQKGNRL